VTFPNLSSDAGDSPPRTSTVVQLVVLVCCASVLPVRIRLAQAGTAGNSERTGSERRVITTPGNATRSVRQGMTNTLEAAAILLLAYAQRLQAVQGCIPALLAQCGRLARPVCQKAENQGTAGLAASALLHLLSDHRRWQWRFPRLI